MKQNTLKAAVQTIVASTKLGAYRLADVRVFCSQRTLEETLGLMRTSTLTKTGKETFEIWCNPGSTRKGTAKNTYRLFFYSLAAADAFLDLLDECDVRKAYFRGGTEFKSSHHHVPSCVKRY